MNELLPNSDKSRREASEPKREVQGVVSGQKIEKKGFWSEMKSEFIHNDAPVIRSYIFKDILIPTIKEVIMKTVTNTLNILFYQTPATYSGRSQYYRGSPNSSTSYYRTSNQPAQVQQETRPELLTKNSEVVFFIPGGIEKVERAKVAVMDLMEAYNIASIQDLCTICETPSDSTDFNYGWRNLTIQDMKTYPEFYKGEPGYILKMPKPVLIV